MGRSGLRKNHLLIESDCKVAFSESEFTVVPTLARYEIDYLDQFQLRRLNIKEIDAAYRISIRLFSTIQIETGKFVAGSKPYFLTRS